MDVVTVCNLGLAEVGGRVQISSLNENSTQANTAKLFYTPKVQMLMRAAPWDSLRATIALTQLKAAVVNGVASASPPPQPFLYEYAWPSDCLKARFLMPTQNAPLAGTPLTTSPDAVVGYSTPVTNIPFVVATDYDTTGNPIKVILTNLPSAQLVYTRDLSQVPDLWDSLFLTAATALLGAYFINALARDKTQYGEQVTVAKGAIDAARAANGNESISNIDHFPDWLQIRSTSAVPWAWNTGGPGGAPWAGWDACEMPGGLWY